MLHNIYRATCYHLPHHQGPSKQCSRQPDRRILFHHSSWTPDKYCKGGKLSNKLTHSFPLAIWAKPYPYSSTTYDDFIAAAPLIYTDIVKLYNEYLTMTARSQMYTPTSDIVLHLHMQCHELGRESGHSLSSHYSVQLWVKLWLSWNQLAIPSKTK